MVVNLKKSLLITVQIVLLYSIFYIGQFIQDMLNLFVPGSVIGLVILFVLLMTNIIPVQWIDLGASFMTRHLVLFFIPATVGVMQYFQLFKGDGLIILLITIVGTLFVMGVSGFVSEKLAGKKGIIK